MTLNELIAALEAADPNQIVKHGFTHPHSYRGFYEDLAFEPAGNVPVSQLLACARSARGVTYQGYKGGDYTMDGSTDCWLAEYGAIGETLGPLLVQLMLADTVTVPSLTNRAAPPMICINCETPVGWINCPTGGWWAHETHPEDNHDAAPKPAGETTDTRTLTESEHNRAWHAIEGAAGEEGADPGTVLNAVLRALGINPPAEESHVVTDDSDDPEHIDDCPGCEAFALTGHRAARPAAASKDSQQ